MIWHSLPLRPPNCQKSRLTHQLLCPRKASHLHQHPIHHIHKMIQFLAKRWNDKKYPPKSNSDLVVVLKNQLCRTYCIRSSSETQTPIEFNSRSLMSRNGFRAFYNIFFISKYFFLKKFSEARFWKVLCKNIVPYIIREWTKLTSATKTVPALVSYTTNPKLPSKSLRTSWAGYGPRSRRVR